MSKVVQLRVARIYCHEIPMIVVHPVHDMRKPVIFYHGWSSRIDFQLSKAYLLAVNGYTVYIPEMIHHGERKALENYYSVDMYPLFWNVIFQNMIEFPVIRDYISENCQEKPVIMGHSLGGLTVLGIGSLYEDDLKGIVSFNGSGDWLLTHLFIQARFGYYVPKDWELYKELEKKSPVNHVKDMSNIPILLTNGENDISIDPRAQDHFFTEIKKSNQRVAHIKYPQLGHFVTMHMMDDAIQWMEDLQ